MDAVTPGVGVAAAPWMKTFMPLLMWETASSTPIFLSDIPALFESRRIPLDAAILQLSRPDKHGYCTVGTSADAAVAPRARRTS
jgi:hypothetical protein